MMSFFKKETKEDKERRKLERKFVKQDTTTTTTTTTSSLLFLTNQNTNETNISNNQLNANTTTTATTTNSNSNKSSSSSSSSSSCNTISSLSSSSFNLNNNNNSQLDQHQIVSTTMSSHHTTQMMNKPMRSHQVGEPLSSLLIVNEPQQQLQQQQQAASNNKPKKGILKTMSKFGIGPPTLTNQTPSISHTNPHLLLPSSTTTASSPQTQKSRQINQIENSIANYSKHSSISTSIEPQQHQQQQQPPSSSNQHQLTLLLPQIKQMPRFITLNNVDTLNTPNEQILLRNIFLTPRQLDMIQLLSGPDAFDQINEEEMNESNVILIETNKLEVPCLPNDQLIALNDQIIIGKSLSEVKRLLQHMQHVTLDDQRIQIKVRTSVECSELILRNTSDSTPTFHHHDISTDGLNDMRSLNRLGHLKRHLNMTSASTTSLSVSSMDQTATNDLNTSVWLMHMNGYTSAKIFAKIIHKQDSIDLLNTTASSSSSTTLSDNVHVVKFKIRLENGNLIEVSEESLEKANPSPQYDNCEDMSKLRYINETSLVHVLRQRYHSLHLIHTYVNNLSMIVMRPLKLKNNYLFKSNSSYHDDRLISLFKGCKQEDMPPHIYAYTQSVYKNMLTNRQDQSILLMGHSGSGKTYQSLHVLNYLFKVAATTANLNANFTELKLNAMYCLLNAFGSIRTARNAISGANRFLNIFLLEFNFAGQLASILYQAITFDQTRVVHQPNDESNYLIFYYLLYGCCDKSQRAELDLTSLMSDQDNANLFLQSQSDLKKQMEHEQLELNKASFALVMESFNILNFEESEIKAIFAILAAILHLGKANACKLQISENSSSSIAQHQKRLGQFKSANDAHKAASLLGMSFNQLNEAVFSPVYANSYSSSNNLGSNSSNAKFTHLSNHGSPDSSSSYLPSNLTPLECLQGFCIGLYNECFNLVTNCINRSFKPSSSTQSSNSSYFNQPISNSMLIIDPPGFQYQLSNNQKVKTPCSYSDLICNYLSERLKLLFFQVSFINPIEKCAQEGLDIDLVEHIPESPSALVNWFDKPPTPASILYRGNNAASSTQLSSLNETTATSQSNNNGLLWILEDLMYSTVNSNDTSSLSKAFVRKLIESDPKQNFLTTFTTSSAANNNNFMIHHQFDQFPIEYNVDVWLEKYNKEFHTQRNALHVLQSSKKEFIAATFVMSAAMSSAAATLASSSNNSTANGSVAASNQPMTSSSSSSTNENSSLKRQASVRKMLTLSKRKTFTINFKLQIDSLFDSLRRTKSNFLFCFLPYQQQQHHMSDETNKQPLYAQQMDVMLVRNQLKAYQLLAACRIYRQGYPEFLNFEEFENRFAMFLSSSQQQQHVNNDISTSLSLTLANDDHKTACINLVRAFDLDQTHYKFGTTQIFFKAGILAKLEDMRDERVNDLIIKLQSHCKRYLAMQSLSKRKLQDSAIRCIQKNIRISFALKKWKWWRLYTNLMPIISVQNNESMLKQVREELDEMRRKNERLLNEKNELKLLNNQLENKLMNLQTEYVEEHAANAGTMQILEVETSERMRLERELNELRPLYNVTAKKLETLETEMLELRLYNTKKSIEEELEKDDIDGLSVATSSSSSGIYSSANSLQTANSPATSTNGAISNHQTEANSNLLKIQIEKLKKDNDMLKRQMKQEKENTQAISSNERQFFEAKLKEKDSELVELEKQAAFHKRRYQKLCEEMQDVQRMCDENKCKYRELEKQQQKFDADMAVWRNKYENEKDAREKCERERDTTKYEVFGLKSELDAQKLETTYYLEKCERLERDLKDYETATATTNGLGGTSGIYANSADSIGNGITTDQYMKMKSQIREMEAKLRDQEDELDEQTGCIQQLEQNKLRLEMLLEKEKQKWQREIAEKESEMDDLRFHTQKKIKAIEMQLEEESEINSSLQREKRELDRRLREITANASSLNGKKYGLGLGGTADVFMNATVQDYITKLRRQSLKYKTLAIDAQTQLEKLKQNIPKQSIMKALKSQLEDSEISKANALKTKQLLQVEINDLQEQLQDAYIHKQHVEEQNMHLNREINNLKSQLEEQERDADEILKKYQNHIQNYSFDSHKFIDLNNQIDILTIENRILKEKIRELEDKISLFEASWVEKTVLNKSEGKSRDLECKLDLEATHRHRLQNQLDRLKQQYEKSLNEIEHITSREKKCEDTLKKAQKQNREGLEELGDLRKRIIDLEETKKRLEQQNEILERELDSSKSEIKTNQNRLEAFQNAFNLINDQDLDEDDDDEDDEEDEEEDDDDEVYRDGSNDGDAYDEKDGTQSTKSNNTTASSH